MSVQGVSEFDRETFRADSTIKNKLSLRDNQQIPWILWSYLYIEF
jgi:hypothetical protein